MTDTQSLIARLEAATGPDWELDAAIFASLNPSYVRVGTENRFYDPSQINKLAAEKYITRGTFVVPAYTASIDAALALVPRGWIVSIVRDFNNDGDYWSSVRLTDSFTIGRGCYEDEEVSVLANVGEKRDGDDPTVRAIVIAALRAIEARQQ